MNHGGKRNNAGRKKIGNRQFKVTLPESVVDDLNLIEDKKSLSSKIRYCVLNYIKIYKRGEK
ncbi:MAG: hypothetical protein ACRC6U_11570 [Fusobacteriaceae bacterium]